MRVGIDDKRNTGLAGQLQKFLGWINLFGRFAKSGRVNLESHIRFPQRFDRWSIITPEIAFGTVAEFLRQIRMSYEVE
jgi:hypothetical protein